MRSFSIDRAGPDLLRWVLCAILFTHGAYRYYEGSLPILGQILEAKGFPQGWGLGLAHAVNLAETAGALLLALGYLVWPISAILCLIYLTGIVLFHWQAGFFVVGPGQGGWEYSALLITCLLATAWDKREQAWALPGLRRPWRAGPKQHGGGL